MQKQLLSLVVFACLALFVTGAQADNPLIRHRDTQALAKGGGSSHATVHYAPVNHRVTKRPEKQANRYMRNEHMSSPMANNNTQNGASRLGQQQPKYVGMPAKKSFW